MGNTIKVLDGQSLLDICIIHSGSLSSLFEIMNANGLTDLTISAGTELFIPEVVNQKVVDYLIQNNLASLPVEYNTGGGSVPMATVIVKNSLNITLSSGSYQPGMSDEVVVNDSAITVNGWTFLSVPAEQNVDFELKDQFGAHIIPSSIDPNGIELHIPQDPVVTVNSAPFATIPTDSPYNVELRDHLGNAITPISIAAPVITVNTDADWIRPSDWLPIDHLVNVGDHKFVGLFAVFSDKPNIIVISSSQAYTVDWGDGTITNHHAGAATEKTYSFSAISPTTQTTDGFRQVVIQIYPQVAPWTGNFAFASSRITNPKAYVANWLDIRISAPNISNLSHGAIGQKSLLTKWVYLGNHNVLNGAQLFRCTQLRYFSDDLSKYSSTNAMFGYKRGVLEDVGNVNLTSSTSIAEMFAFSMCKTIGDVNAPLATTAISFCNSNLGLKTVGDINLPLAVNLQSLFYSCIELISVGTIYIPNTTVLNIAFFNAILLRTIGTITTSSSLTSIQQTFAYCSSLEAVNITNCNGVTNTAAALEGCWSLKSLILTGLTRGITIPPCQMDETAFINFFNSLGTAAGAQTIVITGNITLLPSTIAIATGKGYTITP